MGCSQVAVVVEGCIYDGSIQERREEKDGLGGV